MRWDFLVVGALCAGIGVGLGAFGAHGLKAVLSPDMLEVYKTGVTYQMWHALGLCAIGLLHRQNPRQALLSWSAWLMFAGIVLFSGSLYLLTLLDQKWLGMITPFGGLAFIAGWVTLALYAAKEQR
ncbi:DUF423 domain-containing protein [Methylotuvimicrobium alcaliphilum]|uniref:DUF423 domain-containing protein n=1 Tax=Methylotuvimicrobium alcaliphilum (strain DSM 19304 / NCIMB 14124 / VKM B-2133 / 20Z) TaxID=1091494 RepID=G4SZT1_META2|nr:DUF423 domain-containing protein [Methylotuvimicrobium alcaliphilum]CCE25531.1 conserved membrane protein of unknown function [Methylotuvimicrobium alcaliphilum 20Z]